MSSTKTTELTNILHLPNGITGVGSLIHFNPIQEFGAEPTSYGPKGNGNKPMFKKNNSLLDDTLTPTKMVAMTDGDGNIVVTNYQHTPVRTVSVIGGKDSFITSNIILFTQSEHPERLFIVVDYSAKLVNTPLDESYKFENITTTFSIPVEYAVGIRTLEMYLLQDDPKTSRGTVTTVQSHTHNMGGRDKVQDVIAH